MPSYNECEDAVCGCWRSAPGGSSRGILCSLQACAEMHIRACRSIVKLIGTRLCTPQQIGTGGSKGASQFS
jgi:hypothetical protein